MKKRFNLLLYIFYLSIMNIYAYEEEIIVSIPDDMYPSVLNYFENKLADDLKISSIGESKAELEYVFFDTSNQSLYRQKRLIQYSKYKELNQKKAERIIISHIENDTVQSEYDVKHYGTVATFDEKNPLLKLIKRSERDAFKNILTEEYHVDPWDMEEIVKLSSDVDTKQFSLATGYPISFLIGQSTIDKFHILHEGYSLFIQYDEESSNKVIEYVEHLSSIFPSITVYESTYDYAFDLIKSEIPFANIVIRYPLVFNIAQAIFISFIGFLILLLFFRKRLLDEN